PGQDALLRLVRVRTPAEHDYLAAGAAPSPVVQLLYEDDRQELPGAPGSSGEQPRLRERPLDVMAERDAVQPGRKHDASVTGLERYAGRRERRRDMVAGDRQQQNIRAADWL